MVEPVALIAQTNKEKYKPLIFSLLLGVIGALVNSFSFPFLPEVNLVFGNAVIIIAAMLLRPWLTLLTAMIAITPLYFVMGHPFGFVTFGLEAIVVSYLRSKGQYVLFADIFYWLALGMPITAALIFLSSDTANVLWLFITLKQGFNAAIYATIACLIAFMLDKMLNTRWQQQPVIPRGLKKQLVYAIVLISTLALISTTLFISRSLIISSQAFVNSSLQYRAEKLVDTIDIFLNNQKSAVNIAANWVSTVPETQWQTALEQTHRGYAGFVTMLIADAEGKVTNASPDILMKRSATLTVEDRDYFQQAMLNRAQYVSPIFKGRGFGQEVIIAISTPFYRDNKFNQPAGIVEGSIDLNFLSKLAAENADNAKINTVITDQHGNVTYANPSLNLEPLLLFDFSPVDTTNNRNIMRVESLPDKQFSYAMESTADGWKVYALIDHSIIIREIERDYLLIFNSLLITLLIATFIAYKFGNRITRPLNFIVKQLNQFDKKNIDTFGPLHANAAIEISRLYKEIQSDKQAVTEYQQRLEERVQQRTQALNDANEKLQRLALIDGLTKVHNRRYLDENFVFIQKTAHRNLALMSVTMLDLDHFKQLNDNYGHLVGDRVLIKVAEKIRDEFSRETDTVVRFGGEEFLVIAPYVTAAALADKLEKLRAAIANHNFQTDNGLTVSVSASFGAIIADADYSNDLLKWVKAADECLYRAKDAGRNRVIITDRISRAES